MDAYSLQQYPMVEQVNYPGLETHVHHDVATKQIRGFGGMLSALMRSTLLRVSPKGWCATPQVLKM